MPGVGKLGGCRCALVRVIRFVLRQALVLKARYGRKGHDQGRGKEGREGRKGRAWKEGEKMDRRRERKRGKPARSHIVRVQKSKRIFAYLLRRVLIKSYNGPGGGGGGRG